MPAAAVVADLADLLDTVLWPAVLLTLVLVFREPIGRLAERAGTSAQRLSIGPQGISVDFASAVTPVAQEDKTLLDDLRRPAPMITDSSGLTLLEQLETASPAPHVLIDLGQGREWLSSRLYLFALMLERMRGTRTLVFVETAADIRGRLVGLATPRHVRGGLVRAYPWLEADFANAHADATMAWRTPSPASQALVLGEDERLDKFAASELMRRFIDHVQAGGPPPGGPPPGWVDEMLPTGRLVEHAGWLSGADVDRLLGAGLDRFSVVVETEPRTADDLATAALRLTGTDTVAVVDDRHRFKGAVVDRREALELLAARDARPSAPAAASRPG